VFICRGGDHASVDEISSGGAHVPPKMKTETARSVRRDISAAGIQKETILGDTEIEQLESGWRSAGARTWGRRELLPRDQTFRAYIY